MAHTSHQSKGAADALPKPTDTLPTSALAGWRIAHGLLIAVYLSLALAVSVLAPAFEAPDEVAHFGYIRELITFGRIPILGDTSPGVSAAHEAGQAPLYYILGALATLPAGAWTKSPERLPDWANSNPHVDFAVVFRAAPDSANRALYAHSLLEEFPYRDDVLALHLVRLLSVALGALTLITTILTVREVLPRHPEIALASGALLGLNPQFVFISGVISNDNAAAAAASLALLLAARILRRGLTTSRAIWIGLVIGFALISKLNLLALAPVIALALLIAVAPDWLAQPNARREVVGWLVGIGLIAVGIAGWWYGLNYLRYGDPIAWWPMLQAQGTMTRPTLLPPLAAARELFHARDSYWGVFGWSNVIAGPRVYQGFDLLVGLALLGLVFQSALFAWRRWPRSAGRPARLVDVMPAANAPAAGVPARRELVIAGWRLAPSGVTLCLLAAWTVIATVSLIRWVQINFAGAQGRLLFPAAGAIAILLAIGLVGALPRRVSRLASGLLAGGLALLCAWMIVRTLVPAYAPGSDLVASAAELASATKLDAHCDCGVELVGYRYVHEPTSLLDAVTVDLYWRASQTRDTTALAGQLPNYSLHFGLLDPRGAEEARLLSWPAGGRLPTSLAPVGPVFRERTSFHLPPSDATPGFGTIGVTLFYTPAGERSQATLRSGDGKDLGTRVTLGQFRWPGKPVTTSPGRAIGATFGDSTHSGPTLVGIDLSASTRAGEPLAARLYWRAAKPISADYTVSVQVTDSSGRKVGQVDTRPRGGGYPMPAWPVGELVADDVAVPLAGAELGESLSVGIVVYEATAGVTLGASVPTGIQSDGQLVVAGQTHVSP